MRSEKMTMSSESSNMNDEKRKMSNFSVLVVDDELAARTIHKTMLTLQGADVHLAINGLEAVEFHLAGAAFDLILMDLHMPVMDGYQATRELRDMGINCAIVGLTSGNEAERKLFMESGLDECISKPLSLEKIASYVPRLANKNTNSEAEGNISSYFDYADGNDDLNSSCGSNSYY